MSYAPAPAHLSIADKAAYYNNLAAQLGAPQRPAKAAAPKGAPATIVMYETRWWVEGNRKATLNSSPTTTEAFARRNATHYQGKGYGSEVVAVYSNGRKKVLA